MKVARIDDADPCFTRGQFDVAYSSMLLKKNQ